MLTIDEIRAALDRQTHYPAEFRAHSSQASVAMILADGSPASSDKSGALQNQLEVCFIRRAEREGDPWSGQVAFPGGRASAEDPNAHAVAERETWEEIGLTLAADHRVGPLPIRPIERRDLREPMTLSPFVYYVDQQTKETAFARITEEVAHVFWVPITHLFDETAVTELDYPIAETWSTFPGIQFGDHVIWGLTLRVLDSFAEITQRPLPALKQTNWQL